MRFGTFVKSRVRACVIAAFAICAVCGIAAVCGMPRDAVVLVGAVLVAAVLAALTAEYARSARFYRQLHEFPDQLEHPYQMHSLITPSENPDQMLLYDALAAMGVASANEVARAQETARNHREFTEAWVHEMKTPLAAAMLVAARLDDPDAAQLKHELGRMEWLVNQSLWQARSLDPTRDFSVRRLSLRGLVQRACKENARFLIEHGATPAFSIPEDVLVLADEKAAVFIVSQFVVNAAKYGATRIAFSAAEQEKQVLLNIEDNGWGIPAADVPRVFERGFTGARGREAESSTGMGLYLAANLCSSLGMGATLVSEEGTGTTVTLAFPRSRELLDAGDKNVSKP